MTFPTTYDIGTVSVVNGSPDVSFAGALLQSAVRDGDVMVVTGAGTDWKLYELSVVSDTAATLRKPYGGATGSGLEYEIFRFSLARDSKAFVSKQISDLLSTLQTLLSVAGDDRVVILDKTAATDSAGQELRQAGAAKFRVGMFGDNNYAIQYLSGGTWTDVISVDPSTGAVQIAGLVGKRGNVRAVDTADSNPASAGYSNGAALDGLTLATGDRVLRASASHPERNGVWVAAAAGGASRAADFNAFDLLAGATMVVSAGTAGAGTVWYCSANTGGTLNTTALPFTKLAITSVTASAVLAQLGVGKITISESEPSGGSDGELWFQVTPP